MLLSNASGDLSRGELVNVDKGKVAVKGAEGALTGLAGGTPSALLGKSVATDAAGLAVTTLMEKEKVDN